MTEPSPFDHRPDPELGAALRAVLTGDDDARFTRRVLAAADTEFAAGRPGDWVDILIRWARPGVAAAAVLLVSAALWLGIQQAPNGSLLADPLRAMDDALAVPAFLASTTTPDVDVVLAVALGN